jgi:hypothetical protein
MLTHALRMPNAKEVFFMGLMGLPTHPPTSERVKNTSFYFMACFYAFFYEGGGEAPALVSIRKSSKNMTTFNQLNKLHLPYFPREG